MTQHEWQPSIKITTAIAKHCINTQFDELNLINTIKVIGEG